VGEIRRETKEERT